MSARTLTGAAAAKQDRRRWIALGVIVAAQFMVVLDVAIVNVALPSIRTDLHFSQEGLQWVITAYALLFGGALLLGGRLADLLGRRRLFIAGLALFTVSSLLDGLAWSEGSLIGFRALQGLGAALLSPAALSILTTTFREGRERNLALGIWGAASGSGGAAGVLLGGALTSALSWSWIFFINVPVGALVIGITPWLLRESRADLGHRHFDFAGAASITGGLMLLVYAMTRATQHGWATGETIGLLAASVILIAGFFAIELRSKAPLLPLRIFRLRTLSASNLSGLLMGAAIFSQFFLLTLYMQQVLHYSAIKTGVAYIGLTLTIIAFSAVAQALTTRLGVRRVHDHRHDLHGELRQRAPGGQRLRRLCADARVPDRLLSARRRGRARRGPGRSAGGGGAEGSRARGRRRSGADGGGGVSVLLAQRELDDLVLGLKGLVHVRALLESRGASPAELDEHTVEIDRIRARLAELVKEESRDGFDLNRDRWSRP